MKYLLLPLMLLMISCANYKSGYIQVGPTPFAMWGCAFENMPDASLLLDLRWGKYGKRAIFVEHIFVEGEPTQVLPVDYEIYPTHIVQHGEIFGLGVREFNYTLTHEMMVIETPSPDVSWGDLVCYKDTSMLL